MFVLVDVTSEGLFRLLLLGLTTVFGLVRLLADGLFGALSFSWLLSLDVVDGITEESTTGALPEAAWLTPFAGGESSLLLLRDVALAEAKRLLDSAIIKKIPIIKALNNIAVQKLNNL